MSTDGPTTVRMRPTSKVPCLLERGEIRRVSQDRRRVLVGYHLCCPRCGFVSVAINGSDGLTISESDDGQEVSFSKALRCLYCAVLIELNRGEARIREDEHVRRLAHR